MLTTYNVRILFVVCTGVAVSSYSCAMNDVHQGQPSSSHQEACTKSSALVATSPTPESTGSGTVAGVMATSVPAAVATIWNSSEQTALKPRSAVRMDQDHQYTHTDDLDCCKRCGNCCKCGKDCVGMQAECCVNFLKGCLCLEGGRNCCESCEDCCDLIAVSALWCVCCCGWCGANHE